MPKNIVSDPITDQEMAFARLVLSGGMTDRQAAEAVGLNPDSAAYTKAKPRVRTYMLEHRAAVQQQLVQQEVEGLRRLDLEREQVLKRLWELANLSPETTRGSITGQLKCLGMIAAMQNFIPDRRAVPSETKSAPAPVNAEIYRSEWLRKQQATTQARTHATTNDPQPGPAAPAQEEAQQEDSPACPACPGLPRSAPWEVLEPELAPAPVGEAPPQPVPSQPTFAHRVPLADGQPPYVPLSPSVPELRIPFSLKKNLFKPFVRPR